MKNGAVPKSGSTAQDKSGSKAMPQQAQDKAGTATDAKTPGSKTSGEKTSGEMTSDKPKASDSGTAAGTSKPATADSKTGSPAADTKPATPATAESKSGSDAKSTTTGNAATSATAAPPAEKQSQISTAIRQEKVQEVTNVNFNISIGTAVPATVRYYPLPTRIIEIYPEWRGYDFIVVRGKYIILRPRTHEIVYIIEG